MATWTLLGDKKRISRASRLESESITNVYGHSKVNFMCAPLELGDHRLRVIALCGDVKLRVPESVGVRIEGVMVYSDVTIETLSTGQEEKPIASWTSENFERASVRVHIQMIVVFGEIEIMRVPDNIAAHATTAPLTDSAIRTDFTYTYEGETRRLDHNT